MVTARAKMNEVVVIRISDDDKRLLNAVANSRDQKLGTFIREAAIALSRQSVRRSREHRADHKPQSED